MTQLVVTQDLLEDLFDGTDPKTLAKYLPALTTMLPKNGIDTPARIAMFLSQVGTECEGFRVMAENLNYSAAGLAATFPSHFPHGDEAAYARQPEKIANRVYANRLGNGPEASGDGWKYRGRGAIDVTGKDAYMGFAAFAGKKLEEVGDYLETPEGAVLSGVWFWTKNNLNRFADKNDEVGCTRAVNGGLNGLAARTQIYDDAMDDLQA